MVYTKPQFGWSVATKGNYLIAGAAEEYYGDSSTKRTGLAYLYEYDETTNTWDTGTKIEPITSDRQHDFGESVSISGNYIAISSGQTYVWYDSDNNPYFISDTSSGQMLNGVITVLKLNNGTWSNVQQ